MRFNLSKEELLKSVDDFIEIQRMALSPFFPEVNKAIRGDYLRELAESSYNLIITKEWNYDLDLQESATNLHLFVNEGRGVIEEVCEFVANEFGDQIQLKILFEVFNEAYKIIERWDDQSSPWTIEELQYFCDLGHQSIRNSKNSKGSDYLEFNQDGTVDYQTGLDWLRGRKSYKGLEEDLSSRLISSFSFNKYSSLGNYVRQRLCKLNLEVDIFNDEIKKVIFSDCWESVSSESILDICSLLRFEPTAFFEQLQKVVENERRSSFEAIIKKQSFRADENEPATADAIKNLIMSKPDQFTRHPKNSVSNTKVGIFYCNKNRRCFAHEFNLKNNQHIWIKKSDLPGIFLNELLALKYREIMKFTDNYPDISNDSNAAKGRHSALLVADELKSAELIKLTPLTMGACYKILDMFCSKVL